MPSQFTLWVRKWEAIFNVQPFLISFLCNRKTYHFHHFWIIKVIDNVLQDVTVRHKSESSEHNDDGNFLLYVRQDGNNTLTNRTFTCTLKHITTQGMHTMALVLLIIAFLSDNGSVLSLVFMYLLNNTQESWKETLKQFLKCLFAMYQCI